MDRPRHLERGELAAAPGDQLRGIDLFLRDQKRFRHLAPLHMRTAGDRGFLHAGERSEQLFDLARIDIKTAADDQLRATAEKSEDAAVRILTGEIAGAEP